MPTCGACKVAITVCPDCGGRKCVAGCPDREEDGCQCGTTVTPTDEE